MISHTDFLKIKLINLAFKYIRVSSFIHLSIFAYELLIIAEAASYLFSTYNYYLFLFKK